MKANYPVEFMAASMTLDMGNTDKLSEFRAEAERLGIKVEPPSVNRSGAAFEVEGNTIYYALAALKGVGRQAVDAIVAARGDKPFADLTDFARRINPRAVNKRVLESLAAAGAFDALEPNRARAHAAVDAMLSTAQRTHEAVSVGQNEMFGGAVEPRDHRRSPRSSPGSPADRLQREYDAIGFFLSGHPLDEYAALLQKLQGAVVDRVLPLGEIGRERRPRRRHGRVAHRAAHQDRQQDGHLRPVRSVRALRGDRVRRGPAAVSATCSSRARRCCCFSAPRRRATRCARASSRPSRSIRRPRSCRRACACSCATRRRSNRVAKRLDGKGDGEVSMVLQLGGGAEVEVKLPGRFKVSPQIAGAIKAVPGVLDVQLI